MGKDEFPSTEGGILCQDHLRMCCAVSSLHCEQCVSTAFENCFERGPDAQRQASSLARDGPSGDAPLWPGSSRSTCLHPHPDAIPFSSPLLPIRWSPGVATSHLVSQESQRFSEIQVLTSSRRLFTSTVCIAHRFFFGGSPQCSVSGPCATSSPFSSVFYLNSVGPRQPQPSQSHLHVSWIRQLSAS
ncbi:keratinocyte differentiation-associated protein isoform X1 [Pan troglodytes]|uniref:keratinocyte differentiation-associated protein isoform X1 n=1 Tax=Pan troglodytes TaxID=9598 RepID=UPI00301369F3